MSKLDEIFATPSQEREGKSITLTWSTTKQAIKDLILEMIDSVASEWKGQQEADEALAELRDKVTQEL